MSIKRPTIEDGDLHYLRSIINGIDGPVMIIDDDYGIQLMNDAAKMSLDERHIADIEHPKCYEVSHHQTRPCHGSEHPCPLEKVIESEKSMKVTHRRPLDDARSRSLELTVSPLWTPKGEFLGVMEAARDITDCLEMQDSLQRQKDITRYQADHDSLTGLSNRTLFLDRLHQTIKKAQRYDSKVAVLFIDVDDLKKVNDSFGHSVGDKTIKAITKRLLGLIRDTDTLARIGGDEFAMMVNDHLTAAEVVIDIVHTMMQLMKEPFVIEGHSLYVTLSTGISLHPDDGVDATVLLKHADTAMHRSKDEGRNTYQFYTKELTERAFERIVMETSLREALDSEEFIVHYQPQIDAKTDSIIGMEALVRWEHKAMGLVSPTKFIYLAEETGMIVELDRQVMRAAMIQLAAWYEEGLEPGVLALNLAMKQLQSDDLIPMLEAMLDETGCRPQWLEFEVTEGSIMRRPEQAIETLRKISRMGISLAIDDFGTGHSSLAYLKRLPVRKLKIDRSFVMDIPDDEDDMAITRAVIALAKAMDMHIIAEGVETREQKGFLLENGCSDVQGFLYSRPVPAEKMTEMLRRRSFHGS